MSYKQLRWLILWIPTLTIGLWEYLRHTVLLPYLSMKLGNLLAPLIVFVVTVTLLRKLLALMEETHESLQREQLIKGSLLEREQLARELHDGISQSLFLLSVKLDRLDGAKDEEDISETSDQIRRTVRQVYEDVRQAISNLRAAPVTADIMWIQSIKLLADEIRSGGGPVVQWDWQLSDASLTRKEKVELHGILREALMNVQKHAGAETVKVSCTDIEGGTGFRCRVEDDGVGAAVESLTAKGRFGVRMMRSRAEAMGWMLDIRPGRNELAGQPAKGTTVEVSKKERGKSNAAKA